MEKVNNNISHISSHPTHPRADKPGYKHTALGWIPEDWEVKPFTAFCELKHGFQFREEHFTNRGIPIIKIGNLIDGGGIRNDNLTYIKQELFPNFKEVVLNRGDILMALTGGTLGKVSVFNMENDIYLQNYRVGNFIPNQQSIKNYILHLLQSNLIQRRFLDLINEAAQPNIGKQDFDNIIIPLPPLQEQTAIAKLLSTWDEAISKLQALIDAKTTRKKWLMQQLLTGKKRLPGFEGAWELLHIRNIAKEVSIRNGDDEHLPVLSCTKYDGLVDSLKYFGRKIFSDDLSTYKVVPIGHFAYATNHIEEGSIGYQSKYEAALISPMYTVFQASEVVDDIFLFRLLKSHDYIHHYQKRMEGSIDRRGGLRWEAFSGIPIQLPSLKEQRAISKVLLIAEEEIDLMTIQLNTLKEQKKGLMQQLLTGKVRLKIKFN